MSRSRCISIGTGRPVWVKEHEISAPAPTQEHIAIVQQSNPNPNHAGALLHPFPAYIRLMRLMGELCDMVNNIRTPWSLSAQSAPPSRQEPEGPPPVISPTVGDDHTNVIELEQRMTQAYSELEDDLKWEPAK